MSDTTTHPPLNKAKLAYRVKEAVQVSGLGVTTLYKLANEGRLKMTKVAGRTLILHDDLVAVLHSYREAA